MHPTGCIFFVEKSVTFTLCVDISGLVCIIYHITTKQTCEISGYGNYPNRKIEDSLENTLSCVPKVQG